MTIEQIKKHNEEIYQKIDELNNKKNELVKDENISDDDFWEKYADLSKKVDALFSQLKTSKDIDKEPFEIKAKTNKSNTYIKIAFADTIEETKELIKSYKKHFSDLFADVCYICEGGEKKWKNYQ